MEPTRRPEDEVQLNKTPAEQEEPEYSLEEIMNEFGGWTKREEQAAEPGETVRLASPAGRAPDALRAGCDRQCLDADGRCRDIGKEMHLDRDDRFDLFYHLPDPPRFHTSEPLHGRDGQ